VTRAPILLTLALGGCAIVTDADHAARVDVDGDGLVAIEYPGGTDCDDRDGAVGAAVPWYADVDGDGFGDEGVTSDGCAAPDGYVGNTDDCDDADEDVGPGAAERCNGLDDDCDGDEDEGLDQTPAWRDADDDGFGDPAIENGFCLRPAGWTDNADDCADTDDQIAPGAPERCNGLDDDCDEDVDEGLPGTAWYADADGDGFGDPLAPVVACVSPAGHVGNDDDCDDTARDVSPGVVEACNGLDDDCDGSTDEDFPGARPWYVDADDDGYGSGAATTVSCDPVAGHSDVGGDCDDADDLVSPGASEICSDGVDNDCDGGSGACGPQGDLLLGRKVFFVAEADTDSAGAAVAASRAASGVVVAIGAPTRSDPTVYLVPSPTDSARVSVTTGVRLTERAGTGFASTLAVGPSLDGDAYGDFLIGSPDENFYGVTYVVSPTLAEDADIDDVYFARFDGVSGDGDVGASIAVSSDLTGDGVPDVVVGAPASTQGNQQNVGRVYVFAGPHTGRVLTSAAYTTIRGLGAGARTGASVTALDLNGDGVDDLVVGAPGRSPSGSSSGEVGVWFGPLDDGSPQWNDADVVYTGVSASDVAGTRVANGGDLDGDGFEDLLISAPDRSESGVTNRGVVYVVSGSANPSSRDLGQAPARVLGPALGSAFGTALAPGGDLDGDGRRDFLAGSFKSGADRGRGWLLIGPFAGVRELLDPPELRPNHPGHRLGYSVAPAGDVDGDGLDDALFGATGARIDDANDGAVVLVFGRGG
jgi:hypothetical protein